MFIEKQSWKVGAPIYSLSPLPSISIIIILYLRGTLVTTVEPILSQTNLLVHIRFHSLCCPVLWILTAAQCHVFPIIFSYRRVSLLLKFPVLHLFTPPYSPSGTLGNHWYFYCFHSFAFSGMPYSAIFKSHYYSKVHALVSYFLKQMRNFSLYIH